jgi:pentose-5-phosphate-3-epimerase
MVIEAGCNIITIHPQTCSKIKRELIYIRAKNALTSIAIDPDIKIDYHQNKIYFIKIINLSSVLLPILP